MPSKKIRKDELNISGLLSEPDGETCVFCLRSEDNEEEYGKFIKKCGLQVHYFCMLFASGLCQRGKSEDNGIYGFLPDDIIKEIRRGSRLKCYCCKKKGSTIGCVVGSCSKKFHLGCGRKNGTLHQFFGSFRSFCQEHRPRQLVPISDRLAFYGTANAPCAICMNSVEARASNDTLRSPCCRNAWFHRTCIQKHASTAGLYFFKCPLCNNKEQFQDEMLEFGIYIPDQDAAWETEPNAYNDLLERYLQCDALICRCPNGRKYNRDGGKWEILTCDWCGSRGTHEACHSLVKVGRNMVCVECKEIDDKSRKIKKLQKRKKTPLKKRLKKNVEKKEDIDLDEKGKSEYPGPSSAIIKISPTEIKSPDYQTSPGVSPGMVLRLSYQETDDDVDVEEDGDSSSSLSPLIHLLNNRHLNDIPAAVGSFTQETKRRGRSRHRHRSRSSSSECMPLSSVRQRLRSASRGALRHSSRSSSADSLINTRLRSASKHRKRTRSSSSESPIHKRLRSASHGRSSSSKSPIRKRLRSASRGRKRDRSPIGSPNCIRPSRSVSRGRGRYHAKSPTKCASSKTEKDESYDEVDGCPLPSINVKPVVYNVDRCRPSIEEKKSKKNKHPFSYEGYRKKKKHPKKMLISMEAKLSDVPPIAQFDLHVMTGSSEDTDVRPLKLCTSQENPKISTFQRSDSKTLSKEAVGKKISSCVQDVFDNDKTAEITKSHRKSSLQESQKLRKNSMSPKKPEKTKRAYKKKNKVDSKQMLINKWLTNGKVSKTDNKENYNNKYLTIKWQGKKYIKMLISSCGDNELTPVSPRMCQQSSPNTKQLKTEWKLSPNNRVAQLRQSPVTRSRSPQQSPVTLRPSPIKRQSRSPHQSQATINSRKTLRSSPIRRPPRSPHHSSSSINSLHPLRPSPIRMSSSSPQLSPITIQSPQALFTEEVLERLSEKKQSIVKTYPLRNSSPKMDKEKVRCSLSSKFVDNSHLQVSCPVLTSILEKSKTCSPQKMSSCDDSDTEDYMDDDFLTSDDSESDCPQTSDSAYVIKSYKSISGLEQVQVVLPSS